VFFITEFGAGHLQEIMCKVLRKSILGKTLGQVLLVTLNIRCTNIYSRAWRRWWQATRLHNHVPL